MWPYVFPDVRPRFTNFVINEFLPAFISATFKDCNILTEILKYCLPQKQNLNPYQVELMLTSVNGRFDSK